jgi:hypothetical protein
MRSPLLHRTSAFRFASTFKSRVGRELQERTAQERLKNPIVSVISEEGAHVLVVPLTETLALY